MNKRILVIATFLFTIGSAFSQDPNFHIYLCFGQSNMEGQGLIESQDLSVDSRFQILQAVDCPANGKSAAQWHTATPPLCRCNTGIGPADYFGRTMVENLPENIKVGIVHVAIGGCDIALFDKNNYASYVATAPDWMQFAINDYGGNPYGKLVELAKLAQQEGVIKGILMHQGETNTNQTDWPMKVKGVYDNLITDLDLNAAKVPFLLGEVFQGTNNCCSSHNSIIAQVPSVIPNSYVISSAGLDGMDEAHFNSAGYRVLGERYAEQMLKLLTIDKGVPSVSITEPVANAAFDAPATITIAAEASDSDGSVMLVEFYAGDTKIGESDAAPYTINWNNVEAASYSVTAVATDNEGKTASSAAVLLKVKGAAGEGTITVRARGDYGGEMIALEVDDEVIETWTLTTSYADYTAEANVNGTIRVNYINDADNLDAQVDYIVVEGTTYQAEDQAVNTGLYANGECGGGGFGEYMHCPGYIEFETDPVVIDLCPDDPNKTEPGECGCGTAEGTCSTIAVQLKAGWNLIGCPLRAGAELENVMTDIIQEVQTVKDFDGFWDATIDPVFNTLHKFEYGRGYYIKVNAPCTLIWTN